MELNFDKLKQHNFTQEEIALLKRLAGKGETRFLC